MTGVTAFGWDNYVLDSVITANSEPSPGLDADNVANEWGSPQLAWQTASGVLTNTAGALIRITPRTPAQTWRAVCLQNTNLTPDAAINIALWNDNGGSPILVEGVSATAPAEGYGQVCYVFSADVTADFLQIYFNDAGNPDNFINVPLIYAGPLWRPGTGRTFRSTFGRVDRTDIRTTIGGTKYATPRYHARYQRFEFDSTNATTELWTYAMELDRIARSCRNVLAIPDITSTDINKEAVFGLMETSSAMSFPMQTGELIGWNCRVEERL